MTIEGDIARHPRQLCALLLTVALGGWEPSVAARTPSAEPEPIAVERIAQLGGVTDSVYVEGDRAYFTIGPRLVIADISAPEDPKVLGSSSLLTLYGGAIVVREGFAYTFKYTGLQTSAFAILDVSAPQAIRELGAVGLTGSPTDMAAAGNHMLVVCRMENNSSELRLIDVRDPASPRAAGTLAVPQIITDVSVAGALAYLTMRPADLVAIDLANPDDLREVGRISVGSQPGSEADGLDVAGGYAYVALGARGIRLVDIRDPAAMRIVGSLQTPWAVDITVAETHAFVSALLDGFIVLDVSRPAAPRRVASKTIPEPGMAGAMHIAGRYAYLALYDGGFAVVDIGDLQRMDTVAAFMGPSSARRIVAAGDYAFWLEAGPGLWTLDLRDPESPRALARIRLPEADYLSDVAVRGDLAYVSAEHTLRVLDMTDRAAPVELGVLDVADEGTVDLGGRYLYLAGRGAGLHIIDVADSAAPAEVWSDDFALGASYEVNVVGPRAYVSYDARLRILDVSNSASPQEAGWLPMERTGDGDWWIAVSGHHVLVAESNTLRVIDASDPKAMREVARHDLGGVAGDVRVVSGYAFVAVWGVGLLVYDVSTPTSVRLVASDPKLGDVVSVDAVRALRPNALYAYALTDGNGLVVARIDGEGLDGPARIHLPRALR